MSWFSLVAFDHDFFLARAGDGEDKHLIEDLTKIKREPLVDDDTCVVCLTGKIQLHVQK